jgi:hypothetical protein
MPGAARHDFASSETETAATRCEAGRGASVKNQTTSDSTPIVQGTCPSSSDFAKGFDLVE